MNAVHDFGKVLSAIREVQAEEPEFYTTSGIGSVPVYSRNFSCPVLEVRAYPSGKSSRLGIPFGAGMDEAKELAERIVHALNEGRV